MNQPIIDREKLKLSDARTFLEYSRGKYKTKPGYYVEGRYYGVSEEQARRRAEFLASEWGREVRVKAVGLQAPSK